MVKVSGTPEPTDMKMPPPLHVDAVYRFEGKDKVHTTWRMMEEGAIGGTVEFHFVRQPKPVEAK